MMEREIERVKYKSKDADMIIQKSNDGKKTCISIDNHEGDFFEVSARHMPEIVKFFDALMALEGN